MKDLATEIVAWILAIGIFVVGMLIVLYLP